ncbi:MAG: hypothetical protein A2W77_07015 [Nitrospinae bacterium RIFCSPLOWO2_12_39_16]|nr:MAG: hypothetical protein A2Z59_08970 [Nitrospinae bacterium RIFCSPLOWO2_02_39_17]OGW11472.1 MAG: hypothetical protein A2W77_07015 [Nitrospinae bacterium RIFCSPLOWO2_12_39_16]
MIRTDGYKDTEIGAIPVDWELTFLEKVSDRLKAGGTPKTNVPDYWNGDIPLVKVEDVVNTHKYLLETNLSITKEGLDNSSAYLLPENCLVFSMYGTAGEVAINKIPVAPTQNVLGIIPLKETSVDFLYYALKFSKNRALELIVDRGLSLNILLLRKRRDF